MPHVYIIYCTNQSSPFLKLMSQLQLRPIPTSHRRCRPSSVSGSRVLILLLYCIAVVTTINGCEWIITQVFCVNTDYILPAILGIIIIIIIIGIGLLLHNWKAHLEWVLWPEKNQIIIAMLQINLYNVLQRLITFLCFFLFRQQHSEASVSGFIMYLLTCLQKTGEGQETRSVLLLTYCMFQLTCLPESMWMYLCYR